MEKAPFAKGTIPDGYFGDVLKVNFIFDHETGKTICQHDRGYFTYHTPSAINTEEALWLLEHHPLSKAKNISKF